MTLSSSTSRAALATEIHPQVARNVVALLTGHAGRVGEMRPVSDGRDNLVENFAIPTALETRDLCARSEILQCEILRLAVDGHLVTGGPFPVWVIRVRHIKRRRENPGTALVHEECDVLDVITLVARDHVEEDAADLLLDGARRESQETKTRLLPFGTFA